ncbi:coiled-coil domain-containing protein [Nisaea nitritireducens]|uniref:hypothetical protein n=1 Tax=Nisaea nitritireducens TaxID=568392 RepID=UPI0018693597|nr:hypothetical protein [Nisaea nitritireducens]
MPIRRLPEDGAAAGIYTLLEAIDTMPPVLSRAESAFDRLAGSITGALDRVGAALDSLERLRPTVPSPGTQIPQFQDASFTSSEADLLALGEDRLHLEDLITESMVEQLTASENIATAQEDAARRSDAAWGTLSDDIAQDFDRAFAGISENGADTFASIWQNMASGLGQAISAIDWDNILGDGAGSLASAASSILGSLGGSGGGFSGLFEAGGSLLSSFLPSLGGAGAGAGAGGSFLTGIAGSLGSTGTIGAIAAVAALGLNELFKDKDYPFAKAVIGIQGGTPTAESSFELDDGPLDDLLQLQDRVLTALDAMTDRLGVAFSGNAGNFLQIGYSSGRKSNLPTGYFVGGLETTGDFATGADLSGIEGKEELIARAIELSFAKAVRDGNLTGLPDDAGADSRNQQTFEAGIEKLLAAPFESLETSLRRIDFLASFEETVALFRDGAESVDAYTRALQGQRAAIDAVGRAAAGDAFEPIRLFLEDVAVLFSGGEAPDAAAGLRLEQAGAAVRGMTRDLLDTLSLSGTEAPLEGFALLYEQQAAQITALVPALEALNRELAALGLETIDVAAEINAATDTLRAEVRTLFLQELSPERAAAQQALNERDSLLRQAEQLGYGQDQEILGKIEANFTAQLDRIGFTFSESGDLVQTFADSIEAATAGLDRQISVQENAVGEFVRLAENLTSARQDFALDSSLSPHSPLDRLAQARTGFEELAAASAEGDTEAREDLAASARTYLTLAREVHASSQAYTDIFYQVDAVLASALHETKAQITAAERQLDVLIEIRDRLEPQSTTNGTPQYQSDGGGQYQSGGGGSPFAGYDLGYNPDTNLAILTALDAAGLPLPSGFGEGQLTRLRAENAAVNAVVTAMGFATGGIMTANGPAQTAPYDGGITSDVSVALFGEGSQPEAYVPLPDGRSIPVTLSLPANDDSGGIGETRDALRLQRADSRELVQEMKRLNREVAALRDDNERLNRVLGRAFSRQTA